MDYLAYGRQLAAAAPGQLVLSDDATGRRIWVKRAGPPKRLVWHRLQKILALALRLPVLRPTVAPGGPETLAREAARLRAFAARGVSVPRILAGDHGLLVLSDQGPSLAAALSGARDDAEASALLRDAARALSALHEKNLVHGRPYVRDMTWDGANIGFLDLEEDPAAVMPLADAQARDVFLFLSSAAKYMRAGGDKYTFDETRLASVASLLLAAMNAEARASLFSLSRLLARLAAPLENGFLWKKIGNDARQALTAAKAVLKGT
jgi:hypothetical protein